jgi:hypothetical protein
MKSLLLIALVATASHTLAQDAHQPGGPDCPHKEALAAAASPSHYAGQEQRTVKALSEEERDRLLAGHGMGLARAAELNRFPGPKHVLELASEIGLSDEQARVTQQLFDEMHEEAVTLGRAIVDGETALDRRLANGDIDEATLTQAILEIGEARSRLRLAHLRAHLKMRKELSESQVASYDKLRGYRP